VSAHKNALVHTLSRHGLTATYTRMDNPPITGSVRVANVNYQERPASEPNQIVQMSMRWVVLADDLAAIGIARPYEGDRLAIDSIDLILTVNRYGLRVANGEVIAFDLEATGR
jgi:hypothetical protein